MRAIRPIVPGDFSSRSLQDAVARESQASRPVFVGGQRGVFTTSGRGLFSEDVAVSRRGLKLSDFAFGWVRRVGSTNKVLINGGVLDIANDTVWIEPAEVEVGGDADHHHVIYATAPGIIAPVSALKSSYKSHDETTWRRPLYECYLVNGAPRRHLILWNGIDLKTWFAAPS